MRTNVGQRGLMATGTVWLRRWVRPRRGDGWVMGGPIPDLRTTGVTEQE